MFIPLLIVLGIIVSSMPLAAQHDRMQVAASHSILADVVHHVAGDQADITLLMPAGADPHNFQPTPKDLTAIADAQLVFVNGARFEEQLLEAIENAADDVSIIAASACVEIIAIGSSAPDEHDDEDHDEHDDEDHDEHDDEDRDEHGDEDHDEHDDEDRDEHNDEDHDEHGDEDHDEHGDEDHDEHDDEDHDEHEMETSADCEQHDRELAMLSDDEHTHDDAAALGRLEEIDCGADHHDDDDDHDSHGVCDPHVWMNPRNVMYWTLMIRDSLSQADPDSAAVYAANAAAYLNELLALSEEFIEPALDALPQQKRILITSHDSLGYLAASYDFKIIDTVIPGGSTTSEPSARDVAALIDLIKAEDVPAIFGETFVNENIMRTIARETAAELVVLYSGTLSASDGPAATYLDYMRYNLTAIIDALNGDE